MKRPSINPSILRFGLILKFPDPLLLKIAKNILISIQDVLQIGLFWKLEAIVIYLNKLRKKNPDEFRSTRCSKYVAMKIC